MATVTKEELTKRKLDVNLLNAAFKTAATDPEIMADMLPPEMKNEMPPMPEAKNEMGEPKTDVAKPPATEQEVMDKFACSSKAAKAILADPKFKGKSIDEISAMMDTLDYKTMQKYFGANAGM